MDCVVCGCAGNEECGHKSPDGNCSLDRAGVCPCCNKAGRHCEGCKVADFHKENY